MCFRVLSYIAVYVAGKDSEDFVEAPVGYVIVLSTWFKKGIFHTNLKKKPHSAFVFETLESFETRTFF